jgi:hypothetical protein
MLVYANPAHIAGYPIRTRLIVRTDDFQVAAPHELLILTLIQKLLQ